MLGLQYWRLFLECFNILNIMKTYKKRLIYIRENKLFYKKRLIYLEKIRPFIKKDIIKVLVRQRRVGKSYILFQIMNELKNNFNVSGKEIIYINYQFSIILNPHFFLKFAKKIS